MTVFERASMVKCDSCHGEYMGFWLMYGSDVVPKVKHSIKTKHTFRVEQMFLVIQPFADLESKIKAEEVEAHRVHGEFTALCKRNSETGI